MESTERSEALATVSIDLPAAVEDVWDAISTDEGLAGWMGEGSSVDVSGDLMFPDPVTGVTRKGRLLGFDEHRELSYTWWPEHSPEASSDVTIALEPTKTGTRVTVVETMPTMAARTSISAMASAGTSAAVVDDALAAAITTMVGAWSWRTALLVLATSVTAPVAPTLQLA